MKRTLYTAEHAGRAISSIGKPVIVLDTCALLDLIRVPIRVERAMRAGAILDSAAKILSFAKTTPPSLSIAIPPLVPEEWQDHLGNTKSQVERHISKLDRMINVAISTAKSLSTKASSMTFSELGITDGLVSLAKELRDYGIWLCFDKDVRQHALDRALANRPPARKGAAVNDCIIYDHSLQLFTTLRNNAFSEKCVFMTSNSKDFCCANGSTPKEPIKSELGSISVTLTTDWEWALHELDL